MTFVPYSFFVGMPVEKDGGSEVSLTSQCEPCKGLGKIVDVEAETFTSCTHCGETGTRLTYAGQDILRFVRDLTDHPDIDSEDLPL